MTVKLSLDESVDLLKQYANKKHSLKKARLTLDASMEEWAALASTAAQVAMMDYKIPKEHREAVEEFWAAYQHALTVVLSLPPALQKIAMLPGKAVAKNSGF